MRSPLRQVAHAEHAAERRHPVLQPSQAVACRQRLHAPTTVIVHGDDQPQRAAALIDAQAHAALVGRRVTDGVRQRALHDPVRGHALRLAQAGQQPSIASQVHRVIEPGAGGQRAQGAAIQCAEQAQRIQGGRAQRVEGADDVAAQVVGAVLQGRAHIGHPVALEHGQGQEPSGRTGCHRRSLAERAARR